MDTPPYSDVSAQLSPGSHPIHVNGDSLPSHSTALGAPNGPASSPDTTASAVPSMDIRALYSASFSALDTSPPPTLREILTAYKQKGDGDRDMLLAMLNAKSAEDQRIASQLSLRRTMLEIHNQTIESRSHSHAHLSYPRTSSHSHVYGQGQNAYTYIPEERYHHHHHIAPSSPPAAPNSHTAHNYASSHSHATHAHAHLRPVESPPLSSTTLKGGLPSMRTRPARPGSRGSAHLSDTRSLSHVLSYPHAQIQSQNQAQAQRRKRARRSRSRSPLAQTSTSGLASHRSSAYNHSPTYYSLMHLEAEPDRSPYTSASASASDNGSPNSYARVRTITVGSLLSANSKSGSGAIASSSSTSRPPVAKAAVNGNESVNPAAARVKDERDREEGMDMEMEDNREESWARDREREKQQRRGTQEER